MSIVTASTKKILENGIAVISFVLLWLSFLTFPIATPQQLEIDASWQLVLAHAIQQHWQAGVDYIFTYGPLGYFFLKDPNYDANLFYATVVWSIVASFLLSVVFLTRWYSLHNWLEKFMYLFLLIVIIPEICHFSDAWYLLGMMATTLLLIQPPPFLTVSTRYFVATGVALLGFALLSLTKFNLFIFAVACVTGITIVLWQKYSFKIATFFLIAFVTLWIGLWLVCQQSLGNLPSFIINSWQISNFYSEAMSRKPNMEVVWWALSAISLTSLLMLINGLTKPTELTKFIASGIVLLGLFLSWKITFVRYGLYHISIFFSVAMIVALLLPRTPSLGTIRSLLFSSLLVLNVCIAVLGAFYLAGPYGYTVNNFTNLWYSRIVRNTTILWSLGDYKNANNQSIAQLGQPYDLPKIRATVGDATVDMFPPVQSILFHNALNYHPRPIFQGYIAYTESLLEANGHFYANPQTAPNFIIFNLNTIDNRFPTMEDSNALNVILRDYQPLFVEKGLLLLKHQPRPAEITIKPPLLTKVVNLDEQLELRQFNTKRLFLSLDIQYSLLGKLSAFLFQPPAIMLELETTEGTILTYRLIPSISKAAFLLNPLLLDQTDSLKWYLGKPLKQAATLRVMVESEELRPFFQPTITVKLMDSEINPYPLEENIKRQLQKDLFSLAVSTMPDYVSSPSKVVIEKDKTDEENSPIGG